MILAQSRVLLAGKKVIESVILCNAKAIYLSKEQ